MRSPHAHALIRGIDTRAARGAARRPCGLDARRPRAPAVAGAPAAAVPHRAAAARHHAVRAGQGRSRLCRRGGGGGDRGYALYRRGRRRAGRRSTTSRCRRSRTAGGACAGRAARAPRQRSSNLLIEFRQSYGDVAGAFARAPHRASVNLKQHRGGAHSIEGRGALARLRRQRGPADAVDLDPARPRGARVSDAHARPRREPAARGRARRRRRLRRQVRDVSRGGRARRRLPDARRPIKWIEDRREHFLAAVQERDQYWDLEVAFDDDGRLLGVRGRMIHDQGAYTPQGINLPYNASTACRGRTCCRPTRSTCGWSRPTRSPPCRCAAPAIRKARSRWSALLDRDRATSLRSTAPKCGGAISCRRRRCPT